MRTLSIIILSYNTEQLTRDCLGALVASITPYSTIGFEIIVVDNASSDGSAAMLEQFKSSHVVPNLSIQVILNKENEGFPKGNNRGVRASTGEYVLFLNSDVMVADIHWTEVLQYMAEHPNVGALTVKVNLPTNTIDPASHRGFPTIWNSFTYYSGLEKVSKYLPFLSKSFGGYHLIHHSLNHIHEIDSPSGAFYLMRRSLFDEIGGFDEEFFMYGEDLDLSFRIKEQGYKIIYYPKYTVLHLKHQSGLKKKKTAVRSKTKQYFYNAMKIFYRKHYASQHTSVTNALLYFFIDLKSKLS